MTDLTIWKSFLKEESELYCDKYLCQHLGVEEPVAAKALRWMEEQDVVVCTAKNIEGEVVFSGGSSWIVS